MHFGYSGFFAYWGCKIDVDLSPFLVCGPKADLSFFLIHYPNANTGRLVTQCAQLLEKNMGGLSQFFTMIHSHGAGSHSFQCQLNLSFPGLAFRFLKVEETGISAFKLNSKTPQYFPLYGR